MVQTRSKRAHDEVSSFSSSAAAPAKRASVSAKKSKAERDALAVLRSPQGVSALEDAHFAAFSPALSVPHSLTYSPSPAASPSLSVSVSSARRDKSGPSAASPEEETERETVRATEREIERACVAIERVFSRRGAERIADSDCAAEVFAAKKAFEEKAIVVDYVFKNTQSEISYRTYPQLVEQLFQWHVKDEMSFPAFVRATHFLALVLEYRSDVHEEALIVLAACAMLATKFEDIYPISTDVILSHWDCFFNRDELFKMEQMIFEILDYKVGFSTRHDFSQFFSHCAGLGERQQWLLNYLISLSLCDFDLFYQAPSKVAAAALHLTLQMTAPNISAPVWTADLVQCTGYTEKELVESVVRLRKVHWNAHKLVPETIAASFSAETRCCVAEMCALQYSHLSFFAQGQAQELGLPLAEKDLDLEQVSTLYNKHYTQRFLERMEKMEMEEEESRKLQT